MRIIFVGIHNKPGMKPLDSKTKSGKLIDAIIDLLGDDVECVKSNLFNSDSLPPEEAFEAGFRDWVNRIDWNSNDIVVCLGELVSDQLYHRLVQTLKLPHPSRMWSAQSQIDYINNAVVEILQLKNKISYATN